MTEESSSSLKLLWQSLPVNMKRFVIIIFVLLLCSTFFSIFYFRDALGELIWMSKQMDNFSK